MRPRLRLSIAALTLAAPLAAQSPAAPAAHYVAFGFEPGERVPDARFVDVDGKPGVLSAAAGARGTVIVFRDAECPVSQRYGPRLAEMERAYGAKGFRFLYVDVTPHDRAAAKADAAKYGLGGRTVLDPQQRLVGVLRATSTAETFVVDARGTLRYRGQVDDQYGIGVHRDAPTRTPLRDALDRVAAGQDVVVASTPAPGCLFAVDRLVRGAARPVTYHNRVSRIVQQKCESCHREGGLAPMPLQSYAQVAARKDVISYMTSTHRMPPWGARRGVGEWANDASLSDRDLADLVAWAKAGAPAGNPADAPLPRRYVAGWRIGKPDAVVQIPEPYRVPAQGVVEYRYSYVQTHFDADRWITSMEIRPTAPKNVHHVLVFIEEPGRKDAGDKTRRPNEPPAQGGIDGFFAATAPGSPATVFPLGTGKRLPKGAWLKFQIHYTPNGTEQVDQTQLGLRFADDTAGLREVQSRSAYDTDFEIPPGAPHHQVVAQTTFRRAGTLLSLFPHMHLRGSAFKYELVSADSASTTLLLDVPRYDFNWQTFYAFRTPVRVEPGMRLRATAWYDNSKDNPFNPNPNVAVHFGEQTFEEMMIGYFDWLPDAGPPAPAPEGR